MQQLSNVDANYTVNQSDWDTIDFINLNLRPLISGFAGHV